MLVFPAYILTNHDWLFAVMRQCIRRRIQLSDVPSEAFFAKSTRFRHYVAVDEVVEGVGRDTDICSSRIASDQTR
jgi:hypothetical protein